MEAIISHVLREVYPKYHTMEKFAHGLEHILFVTSSALSINEEMRFGIPMWKIIAAAGYHDISLIEGRENHAERSANYFRNDKFIQCNVKEYDIEEIATAIREHSSSYKGTPTTALSIILRSADRCVWPDVILSRYIQASTYRWLKYEVCRENVYEELVERYAPGGHAVKDLIGSVHKISKHKLQELLADKEKFNSQFSMYFEELRGPLRDEVWRVSAAPLDCDTCEAKGKCLKRNAGAEETLCSQIGNYYVVRSELPDYKENCRFNSLGMCTACHAAILRNEKIVCEEKICPLQRRGVLFPSSEGHEHSLFWNS